MLKAHIKHHKHAIILMNKYRTSTLYTSFQIYVFIDDKVSTETI